MTTLKLTPGGYEATAAKLEKINTRAAKRGFTGRFDLTAEWVTETKTNHVTGLSWDEVWVHTTITGEPPAYGGWEFLAAADALPTDDGEAAFVLRYAPGAEPADGDREALVVGRCQHCGTVRANRRYTYLVRHTTTGTLLQVGRTCMKDFTGWHGTPVFYGRDEVADELAEHVTRGGFTEPGQTPVDVVAVAHAAVREFGWVPASVYSDTPTRERVMAYFYGTSKTDRQLQVALAARVAEGQTQAPHIVATLRAGLTGHPGYEANLLTALGASYVGPRQFGLVVSAVGAYDRLLGREAERKAREADQPDRTQVAHQGVLGDKLTVTGTITRHQWCSTMYGPSALVVVENATTVAKMFTTAAWADTVETGQEVTVTGTVKAHEHYQGTPQTVLTRAKLATPAPAAPAAA